MLSTTHKKTPQIITQPRAMTVYHDDNHEPIQPFDEVVYVRQPWWSATPCYNLPRTNASTPIITSISFQNQWPHIKINLVPNNVKMEWFHLLNRLEQFCDIDWKLWGDFSSLHSRFYEVIIFRGTYVIGEGKMQIIFLNIELGL
jgi:hypothetical protein